MTPTPIPASLATACAAHDRHRLDVLDALLDEAAPSAVRELLGAALDLCASLRADRDTLAAKLDAAPKVCAIHSYEHGPGPCMTCGAWPPGTRELIAACQARIAGLEQAADERSAEVARLTARVAELEARPVLTAQSLCDALVHARAAGDFLHVPAAVAADVANRIVTGGSVTLPAQDRAEELAAAFMNERAARGKFMTWAELTDADRAKMTDAARVALASLGAPPTSRDTVRDAMERAAERFGGPDGVFSGAGFSNALMHAAGLSGAVDGRLVRAILAGRCDVQDRGNGHYQIAPSPTSPPAARPVFAEVSEDELIRLFYVVGTDGIDHGEQCPPIDSSDRNGLRAVLARLEVSLVTPVDLAAIERAVKAYHNASGEHAVPADALGTGQWRAAVLAMTDAFLAAGIPITPEVGK